MVIELQSFSEQLYGVWLVINIESTDIFDTR